MANAEQNAYDSYVAERSCCILLVVDKNTVFILPVIQCHSHKARTPRENSSIMESHLKTYKGICAMSTYKGICAMSTYKGICAMSTYKGICAISTYKGICAMSTYKGMCAMSTYKGICAMSTYKGICAMSTYKGICVMSYDCLPLTSSLATLTMARIGVTPP
jgi:hypothetical protein